MTVDSNETLQLVCAVARARKEAAEEQRHGLVVVRDGRVVAWIDHTEMGDLLGVVPMAAGGYGADALAVVLEAVFPLVPANPVTGEEWRRGEADELWREHDGAAKGWVSECLVVEFLGRDGSHAGMALPFTMGAEGIEWTATSRPTGGAGLAQALGRGFQAPVADPGQVPDSGDRIVAAPDAPLLPPEQGRLVLDVGLTRILDRRFMLEVPSGSASLVVPDEAAAQRYRDQGLEYWQVLVQD